MAMLGRLYGRGFRSDNGLERLVCLLFGGLLSIGAVTSAQADTDYVPYQERVKSYRNVAALPENSFGERMDMYKGSLSFYQEDFVLHGTGPDIVIARSYSNPSAHKLVISGFADWELVVPRIETYSPKSSLWLMATADSIDEGKRCSNITIPALPSNGLSPDHWWNGYQLIDESGGSHEILARGGENNNAPNGDTSAYPLVTQSKWQISCLDGTSSDTLGEAFLAIAPDGTKYWFDYLTISENYYISDNVVSDSLTLRSPIYKAFMLVTRIEDRFGNYLTYNYSGDQLESIAASDGREVDFTWSDGEIQSASSGGRTWNYSYQGLTDSNGASYTALSEVIRPDLTTYQFSLSEFHDAQLYSTAGTGCGLDTSTYDNKVSGSIVGPTGLTATYQLSQTHRGRSNVPYRCDNNETNLAYSPVYDVFALVKRTYSGVGVNKTWSYAYGSLNASFDTTCASTNCVKTVTLDETDPNGVINRYTFSNEWSAYEGKLLSLEKNYGSSSNNSIASYSYANTSGMAYPSTLGTSYNPEAVNELPLITYTPQNGIDFSQNGDVYRSYNIDFDEFAQPTSVWKWSPMELSKTTTISYFNDTGYWVIGLVASQTNDDTGLVEKVTSYTDNDQPEQTSSFGRVTASYTYNSDGTLATIADGAGHQTSLSDWYRGLPRKTTFADNTSQSAEVNDWGWLTSITDELGNKTCYAYDAMGRVNEVTYPSGSTTSTCDTGTWNPTTLAFEAVNSEENGIAAGHWRQTITTGNDVAISYFNAEWQPLLQQEYDAADSASTLKYIRYGYDNAGRLVFTSYPSSSATADSGSWTTYDALGRVTSKSIDSESGLLTTQYSYSGPNTIIVTDPKGNTTVTSSQDFDSPTYQNPVYINAAEGQNTYITRDLFGKIKYITRLDTTLTRYYVYRTDQLLCKIIEPETGVTVYDYDAAGNRVMEASGLSTSTYSSMDSCDESAAWSSGRAVTRSYDARNRLLTLAFPDGRGNQSWAYYADGLPRQITTNNADGDEIVTNVYTYNSRRSISGESITQPDEGTKSLGYGYDANSNLSTLEYPSGLVIAYAPNALGQPTQAGVYATAVSYYPNGAIKQFTLGNGIVQSAGQNARLLPSRLTYAGNATPVDLGYSYDSNGNVSAITDYVDGSQTRSMAYDGLDRLLTAQSTMFGGDGIASYSYDVLDNLKTVKVGSHSNYRYTYNSSNQLETVTDVDSGAAVIGLGYDVQGNLENRNGQAIEFDYGNRMRAVTGVEAYRYDANGRRVANTSTSLAAIYSYYGSDGVLRWQDNKRTSNESDYIYLGRSLVAQALNGGISEAPGATPTVTVTSTSTSGSYTVSWTTVALATRYTLEESGDGGSNWSTLQNSSTIQLAISGKSAGTYAYRVKGCNDFGCGPYSSTATITVNTSPPAVPSFDSEYASSYRYYVTSDGSKTLTYYLVWTTVDDATSYEVTGAVSYTGTGIVSSNGAWAYITQAKSGSTTAVQIRACNANGCSDWSDAFTPPLDSTN